MDNIYSMKRFLLAMVFLAGFCLMQAQDLAIGGTLPKGDLKVKDISGGLITLNDAKSSSGLLVIFTSNTCPYVVRNQARTKDICAYAAAKGLGVVLLNSNDANRSGVDSYAEMQDYAKKQDYKWRYAVDSHSELANAFGANRTPECYLFDAGQKLVYHGAIDDNPADERQVNRKHLQEAISEMIAGKEVSVKETRSVGCTIQRRG
jgi:thioredoxin-related protein